MGTEDLPVTVDNAVGDERTIREPRAPADTGAGRRWECWCGCGGVGGAGAGPSTSADCGPGVGRGGKGLMMGPTAPREGRMGPMAPREVECSR